jgi:hypothetical protein
MKRRIALFAMILAISLLVGELNIDIANANFFPIPSIYIRGYNPTYPNGNNYTFTVEVHISMDAPAIVSISYSLDDKKNITISNLQYTTWMKDNGPNNHQIYSTTEYLYNLESGNHTINAYATDSKGKVQSTNHQFTIGNKNITNSITPTTSQSMPTINTGPKLPLEFNSSIAYIILAIVIVIIAVASISLVYFKKRRERKL